MDGIGEHPGVVLAQNVNLHPHIIDGVLPDGEMVVAAHRAVLLCALERCMPAAPEIRHSAIQDHISIRIIRDAHIRQPIEPLVIGVINAIGDGIGRHTAHNLGSIGDEGVPVFIGNRVALW